MTVRVYQSTDTSAPVLTGVAGSLIALLDAVLVAGYGTQTAAGWTKPFNGINKGVYKHAGSNGYFRFVDDASANADASWTSATDMSPGPTPASP